MGPLAFLNGAFLAALAAAILPILIHLLSRRRAREMPFSHLRFLDEITRRKVRRMRLRQWLLLALRTLAIALIALALSRPVWHGPGVGRERGTSTVVLLIDDSFSMEARLDASGLLPVEAAASGLSFTTRFDQARRRALEIVGLLEDGDQAHLVFTAAPARAPYEGAVRDADLLREEIERARPRATRSDLIGALERAGRTLAAARTLNRELFIVSDFQRSDMQDLLRRLGAEAQGVATGAVPADSAPRALIRMPEGTRIYLVPVQGPAEPNLAIVWSFFEPDPSGAGGRLNVRARNAGESPVTGAVVQVLAEEENRLLAEAMLDVQPGSVGETTIHLPEIPASGRLLVQGPPDLLERDDRRYVGTAATSQFNVVLITGGGVTDPQVREEIAYPILALDPFGGPRLLAGEARPPGDAERDAERDLPAPRDAERDASAPRDAERDARAQGLQLFAVETVAEADLVQRGALEADAVVLLNVGRLSASAAELLERYHAEGGNVLIALGDRVDPRIYNTQILPRLTSVRLENLVVDPGVDGWFSLLPTAPGHEIFAGFPVAPGDALTGARFRRCLEVRLGPQSRVLGEFSGGRPALIEEPGVLLFTSALDLRWSDFPTSASYLPFLHRTLLHLILQGRMGRQEPVAGGELTVPIAAEASREPLRCIGPDGLEVPVELQQSERGPLLRTAPVPEAGFYRIEQGGRTLQTIAVNLDARESDLAAMSPADGALVFGADAATIAADAQLDRRVLETRHGRELWRLCLVLAFLVLAAESLIARGRLLP